MVKEELAHAGAGFGSGPGGDWCAKYPALGLQQDFADNLFTAQAYMLYILHYPANYIEFRHGLASSGF